MNRCIEQDDSAWRTIKAYVDKIKPSYLLNIHNWMDKEEDGILANTERMAHKFELEHKAFHPPITITFRGNDDIEIPFCTEKDSVRFNIIKKNEENNDAEDHNDEEPNAWVKFKPLTLRLGLSHYNSQTMGKLILHQPE